MSNVFPAATLSIHKARPAMALATYLILLLASAIGCFLASKRWHWSHVFVVEVLFLSGLFLHAIASDVMRFHAKTRSGLESTEMRIETTEPLAKAVESGTRDQSTIDSLTNQDLRVAFVPGSDPPTMKGANELDHELGLITRIVGRNWGKDKKGKVVPQGQVNPQTGEATVKVEFPQPHGIEANSIVYVFEEGEPTVPDATRGPQYLGEFRVTGVAADIVKLEPVGTWDDQQKARLGKIRGSWIIYESMPIDQHPDGILRIFADVAEDDWGKFVPPSVVDDYRRHGTPATPDDDEWHKVGLDADGNVVGVENWDKAVKYEYRRELRDYNYLFAEYSNRWIQLLADKASLKADNEKLQATLISAKELQAYREAEQAKLKFDLAGVQADRKAIEAHLAALETSLANAKGLLAETLNQNLMLATQLAAAQAEAAAAINQVTEPVPARAAN